MLGICCVPALTTRWIEIDIATLTGYFVIAC